MLIRKNTKAFKTILEIVSACQGRADREQLIRLFITRAGNTVKDRISVDSIQGDSALFYEMNYQTVLNSLRSSNHQLNESEEFPGLYYFHSTSNKSWDETPFEFDEVVTKEFSALPDLPTVRKKEKFEKFVLPTSSVGSKSSAKATENTPATKVKKVVPQGPKQPDFKLKHKIEFTNLDKIVFRNPLFSKEQILTYYNKISEHMLPYLKDRTQWVRSNPDTSRPLTELTKDSLFADDEDSIPGWLETGAAKKTVDNNPLVINDKEHLLLSVERGVLEFHPAHSKRKQNANPDYIFITIDSPESDITKAVKVAQEAKTILDGLKLPSFVKTNGSSQLDVYIPLDSKSNFKQSYECATYICRLINLKIPHLTSLVGSDENDYGKVALDYSLNEEGQTTVAPYSLVTGEPVAVATPLLWEEVNDSLDPGSFDVESIFKRLKQVGDPFEDLYKKKVNAAELLERLEANYSFLF